MVATQLRYINTEWRDRPDPPSIGSRETRRANTAYQDVQILDARAALHADLGLDTSGFTITRHHAEAPGHDSDRLKRDYYAQMTDLVKRHSGADCVYAMSHQIRTEDRSDFNSAYARFVHCDYNLANLQMMSLNTLKKHDIKPRSSWQYAWYNTWQPFDSEVKQNALAMCDTRSLADGDVIDYRYTGYLTEDNAEGGLVSAPVYNADHRWYYYPDMQLDEVLLTKQLDEREGKAALCPHSSFIDAAVGEDVPPRRSIEMRLLAVFDT